MNCFCRCRVSSSRFVLIESKYVSRGTEHLLANSPATPALRQGEWDWWGDIETLLLGQFRYSVLSKSKCMCVNTCLRTKQEASELICVIVSPCNVGGWQAVHCCPMCWRGWRVLAGVDWTAKPITLWWWQEQHSLQIYISCHVNDKLGLWALLYRSFPGMWCSTWPSHSCLLLSFELSMVSRWK